MIATPSPVPFKSAAGKCELHQGSRHRRRRFDRRAGIDGIVYGDLAHARAHLSMQCLNEGTMAGFAAVAEYAGMNGDGLRPKRHLSVICHEGVACVFCTAASLFVHTFSVDSSRSASDTSPLTEVSA